MKSILLITIFSFFALGSIAQEKDQIMKIHEQLELYFKNYPIEKIFLSTDKEVYKPNEIIWFDAFVSNLSWPRLSSVSADLHVALYNETGELVVTDIFRLLDGKANGDLKLPEYLAAGRYVLEAHTGYMENEDEAFLKLVFIDPMGQDDIITDVKTIPEVLIAGANNPVELSLHELSGKAFSSGRIKYELFDGGNSILKGKLKSESNGRLEFNLAVPEKEYQSSLVLKLDDSRDFEFTRSIHVSSEKLKVLFFAEGGNFAAGTPLKIGFMVTNSSGQPVNVSAEVAGDENSPAMLTKTLVPGYGVFPILAKAGVKYKMHLTSDLGHGQVFDLPEFVPNSFVCSVSKSDSGFIYTNLVFTDGQQHSVNLMVTKGSQLFWASQINVDGAVRAKLPKENFPQGLCLLSVFDQDGKLIGDRLLYVDKSHDLNVNVDIDQEKVISGQPITLKLKTTSSGGVVVSMAMAVSVSAGSKKLDVADQLIPCFVINNVLENKITDLSRFIENGTLPENSMNHLLICNRFKNYSWQTILDFEVENVQSNKGESWLAGLVMDQANSPVQNAKVSLLNTGSVQIMNVTTDENGHFVFPGIKSTEADQYVVKAIDWAGNNELIIEYERNFLEKLPRQIQRFLDMNAFVVKPQVSSQFYLNNTGLFSAVKKKPSPEPEKIENYKKMLSSGSSIMDVLKMIKPFQSRGNMIIFPGGQNSLMAQDGALIVIDGQKMGTNATVLDNISPTDVETIRVSTNPADIMMYTGLNSVGLVEITTKRGPTIVETTAPEENLYDNGFRVARNFVESMLDSGNENGTTLFWAPSVKLDENGMASLQILTNNVAGTFQIEVEAVDESGWVGKSVKTFEVTK